MKKKKRKRAKDRKKIAPPENLMLKNLMSFIFHFLFVISSNLFGVLNSFFVTDCIFTDCNTKCFFVVCILHSIHIKYCRLQCKLCMFHISVHVSFLWTQQQHKFIYSRIELCWFSFYSSIQLYHLFYQSEFHALNANSTNAHNVELFCHMWHQNEFTINFEISYEIVFIFYMAYTFVSLYI